MTQNVGNRLVVAYDSSYDDPVSRREYAKNLKVSAAVGTGLLPTFPSLGPILRLFRLISPKSHVAPYFYRSSQLKALIT